MMARLVPIAVFALWLGPLTLTSRAQGGAPGGLYPDLRTVVPLHVQLVNEHQREIVRFSNGIANTGSGPWRMRPRYPIGDLLTQDAVQEILDADGHVVEEKTVSRFEFHPEHGHWHIYGVALFELRVGHPFGSLWGNNSLKTTFCLVDWYALEGKSRTRDRGYVECGGDYQGISPGWVDQYHQQLDGQQLDITGAPPGLYYLVSTTNAEGTFFEEDTTNNTAWVGFMLTRRSNGNARIEIVDRSPCDSPGLCGVGAPNR